MGQRKWHHFWEAVHQGQSDLRSGLVASFILMEGRGEALSFTGHTHGSDTSMQVSPTDPQAISEIGAPSRLSHMGTLRLREAR